MKQKQTSQLSENSNGVRENPQAQGGQQQGEKRIGNYYVGK
jgi:hypothetical protein